MFSFFKFRISKEKKIEPFNMAITYKKLLVMNFVIYFCHFGRKLLWVSYQIQLESHFVIIIAMVKAII